ncbi:MAG: lipid-binding SYLF domain-containing protein [Gammaproteobacteria bacterium]|nr:lipid-binding SYLF domain-containing protein [Gammaproteobacteria bacterium]
MSHSVTLPSTLLGLALLLISTIGYAGGKETATIWSAVQVLEDILGEPAEESIPVSLLQQGDGVVILPGMLSVGWGVGLSHGSGVMLFRRGESWNDPIFVNMTGASFGYQIGAQSSDLILSFKRPNSIDSLLNGKLTLGVDAAITAGPIGRDASVATDATLDSEIYSWSRSRGLFVGVALDGSALTIDEAANASFYGKIGILAEEIIRQPTLSRSSGVRRLKGLLNQKGIGDRIDE